MARASTAPVILAALVCALVLPVSAIGAREPRPSVRVTTTEPFTVVGSHFDAGERVNVVVRMNGRFARTVVASREGRFAAVFRAISYDTCSGYLVVATGDRGNRARMRLTPECTPFQPAS
jgi:hypothetical protein